MSEPAAAIDYRSIFNCTAAAILIIDKDAPVYTILDVNDAYLSATNSNRETLVGRPVFAAFPANPTDEVSKNIERTIFPSSRPSPLQSRIPCVITGTTSPSGEPGSLKSATGLQ